MKRLLCCLFVLSMLLTFDSYALNVGKNNISILKGNKCDQEVVETLLSDGIKRKESITCYEISKGDSEIKGNYKYITMRLDVTYLDKDGNTIAAVYIASNFRYNSEYKEAKCLSTSHGETVMNDSYTASGFARTKNIMWTNGEAYGMINVSKGMSTVDSVNYILKCDYNGKTELVRDKR